MLEEPGCRPPRGRRSRLPKLRGRRRYYRRLREAARDFKVNLEEGHWYDLWHHHFDFFGRGNRSQRERREHLAAYFQALARARAQIEGSGRRVQVWLSIHPADSSDDAIYVHSANPNPGSDFPYQFSGSDFDCAVPDLLKPYLLDTDYLLGRDVFESSAWYSVVPPESQLSGQP